MKLLSIEGMVLFEVEVATVKALVVAAVKAGADLSEANLSGVKIWLGNRKFTL
jgi:uncharacterized protein YjbI with pentapeptide repeats